MECRYNSILFLQRHQIQLDQRANNIVGSMGEISLMGEKYPFKEKVHQKDAYYKNFFSVKRGANWVRGDNE